MARGDENKVFMRYIEKRRCEKNILEKFVKVEKTF